MMVADVRCTWAKWNVRGSGFVNPLGFADPNDGKEAIRFRTSHGSGFCAERDKLFGTLIIYITRGG